MAQYDALLPRPPGGMAPGAALALLVHGGLVAALALGVNWRMTKPEPVSAELWAALPQIAAPRPEAPPEPVPATAPPPRPAPAPAEAAPTEAQIAIERAERRRVEREKQEEATKAKAKLAADEKKREAEARQAAEETRLAKSREDQLRRMMGSLPGTGPATSTGTASQDAAPSQAYVGQLVRLIRSNWVFSGAIDGNPAAEVEVVAAVGGSIISRRLVKSSGNPDFDESVLRAVDRTRTLPRDSDGRVPPSLIITFRPKE